MAWQYPGEGEDVLVVHTLCVPPRFAGHRYGSRMVQYAKEYAAGHGCAVVRLDTYAHNEPAKRCANGADSASQGGGRIAPRAHGRGAGVSGVQVAMSIGVVAVSIGE